MLSFSLENPLIAVPISPSLLSPQHTGILFNTTRVSSISIMRSMLLPKHHMRLPQRHWTWLTREQVASSDASARVLVMPFGSVIARICVTSFTSQRSSSSCCADVCIIKALLISPQLPRVRKLMKAFHSFIFFYCNVRLRAKGQLLVSTLTRVKSLHSLIWAEYPTFFLLSKTLQHSEQETEFVQ